MNFQGVAMNVIDLDRLIDFCHEVLDFTWCPERSGWRP